MAALTTGVGVVDTDMASINELYEKMGLAGASDRARFAPFFEQPRPALPMTITISSTSLPHGD